MLEKERVVGREKLGRQATRDNRSHRLVDRREAADHGRSNPRNQRWIDFLRSTVLMTEDSSSHWPIKRRYVYSETSRRAGLEFVYIFGHNEIGQKQPNIAGSKRAINAGSTFCGVAAAPVNTLRQQTHRCQEISVCF